MVAHLLIGAALSKCPVLTITHDLAGYTLAKSGNLYGLMSADQKTVPRYTQVRQLGYFSKPTQTMAPVWRQV
jgi:hypothetical protein